VERGDQKGPRGDYVRAIFPAKNCLAEREKKTADPAAEWSLSRCLEVHTEGHESSSRGRSSGYSCSGQKEKVRRRVFRKEEKGSLEISTSKAHGLHREKGKEERSRAVERMVESKRQLPSASPPERELEACLRTRKTEGQTPQRYQRWRGTTWRRTLAPKLACLLPKERPADA